MDTIIVFLPIEESVMKVKAYAAKNEKGMLEPYEYELGENQEFYRSKKCDL